MNDGTPEKMLESALVKGGLGYAGNDPVKNREVIKFCLGSIIAFLQQKQFPAEGIMPLVSLKGEIENLIDGRSAPLFTQDLPEKEAKQPPKSKVIEVKEATFFAYIVFLNEENGMSREQAAAFVEACAIKYNKDLPRYNKVHESKNGRHPYLERLKKFMSMSSKDAEERNDVYRSLLALLKQLYKEGTPAKTLVEAMIKQGA